MKREGKSNKGTRKRSESGKSRLRGKLLDGIISINIKGFGFLLQDGEDIFIPAHAIGGALHGDEVRVRVVDGAGEVVKVLERTRDTLVGSYLRQGEGFVVKPDDRRYPFVQVPENSAIPLRNKVVVKLSAKTEQVAATTSRGKPRRGAYGRIVTNITGRIIENLGESGAAGVDILSIIRAHGLREEFPKACEREAALVSQSVESVEGREDFRNRLIITIDGEDAKDLDDAISISKTESGYELGVYIADVAHYVQPDTAIDVEASIRTTSVYFPDRVLPMLPRQLSNGICSLNAGEDRLVLACVMRFDRQGRLEGSRIVEGVIRSSERMTYTDCNALLGGEGGELATRYSHILPMLQQMKELADRLTKRRFKRGSINFDLPEAKIVLNEAGQTVDVKAYERGVSNRIIEEFMLAANECVAEFANTIGLPFVYRVHEKPDAERVEALIEFLEALGESVTFGREVSPKALQALLEGIKSKDYYGAVSKVVLRTMQKARYDTDCLGHYGLAAEFYCHFTSPIRRYPDLAIHRVLKYILGTGCRCELPSTDELKAAVKSAQMFDVFCYDSARMSSLKEKGAEEAERQVDDLKKAEFMQAFIGERFSGVVSGVTDFGFFVELPNTVEGLVRVESLRGEFFFDERHYCLRGRNACYRLGDTVDVVVLDVNMSMRRVEFGLAE